MKVRRAGDAKESSEVRAGRYHLYRAIKREYCRVKWIVKQKDKFRLERRNASCLRPHRLSIDMASNQAEQVALIKEATRGIEKLLNNDLQGAQELLRSRPESAGHGVGLGISCFLQAALGQEDNELAQALDVLVKAEAIATAQSAKKGEKGVYPAGLEYKVSCRSFNISISPYTSLVAPCCSSCCTTSLGADR